MLKIHDGKDRDFIADDCSFTDRPPSSDILHVLTDAFAIPPHKGGAKLKEVIGRHNTTSTNGGLECDE
jgi:hypothetical protein